MKPQPTTQHLPHLHVDLSTRESLLWWNEVPTIPPARELATWWTRFPALTVPQFLALHSNRAPAHVSGRSVGLVASLVAAKSARRQGEVTWKSQPLVGMSRIWQRTHRTTYLRVSRSGPSRRPAQGLSAIWAWVRPDDLLESRYLIAGLLGHTDYVTAARRAGKFIREAVGRGWLVIAETQRTPVCLIATSDSFQRETGRPVVRFPHHSRSQHRALAIEAALTLAAANNTLWQTETALADDSLNQRAREGKGLLSRGANLPAIPDVELASASGHKFATELLSNNYRNDKLADKWHDLPYTVSFVGTDHRVASRFARVNRGALCFHL